MALLPCLRWGDARWWLPLQATTADCLAASMLAYSADDRLIASDGQRRGLTPASIPMEKRSVMRLGECLAKDPSLLTFVSLRWLAAKPSRAAKKVGIRRLAKWFSRHIIEMFSENDAMLGAPPISDTMLQQWQRLYKAPSPHLTGSLPQQGTRWMEVVGPPVPDLWRCQWPSIRLPKRTPGGDTNKKPDAKKQTNQINKKPFVLATLSLTHLAHLVQRERSLRLSHNETLQSQKLDSLKQFAYGLSHEINNPLANIVARVQLLQRKESDPLKHTSMERVVQQAMRAHEMIADVMFYANPARPDLQPIDIGSVVRQALDPFQDSCDVAQIRLQQEYPQGDSTRVCADPAMLHDAVSSLVRNAVEAIGHGGDIHVRVGRRDNGSFVQISDNGPGLSEHAREHAFDPYYSGREAGRGLGLGLCRVYRIAKLHCGKISLSRNTPGCVATLWLPNDHDSNPNDWNG